MNQSAAVSGGGHEMNVQYLQRLCEEPSLEALEAGLETAFETLDEIKCALKKASNVTGIADIIRSIDTVKEKATPQAVTVGVVGSTGAGKSSIINSVLDEESLVPTNSMRACTAVITEIIYNHSDKEDEKYRAEVHFICPDDWKKELQILLGDLRSGEPQSDLNSESEASIAYSKVCVRNAFSHSCPFWATVLKGFFISNGGTRLTHRYRFARCTQTCPSRSYPGLA